VTVIYEPLFPVNGNTVPPGSSAASQPASAASQTVSAPATQNDGVTLSTSLLSQASVMRFHEQGQWSTPNGGHGRGQETKTIGQITVDGKNGNPAKTVDIEHLTKQVEFQAPDGGPATIMEMQLTRRVVIGGPDGPPTSGGPVGPPTSGGPVGPPTSSGSASGAGSPQAQAASAYALTGQLASGGN